MDKKDRPVFISLDAIPEGERSYLPKLQEDPIESILIVTQDFLEYLASGKVTLNGLEEHLQDLEAIKISHATSAALATAAYEQASALGLTDQQRGMWFYNLMMLGCDPASVKQAISSGHDLRALGYSKNTVGLEKIVAEHYHTRYSPHKAH